MKTRGGNAETILAQFPLSALESVEENVAKQHGLELVRRFTIGSLNKRIVVFRVPDARAVADVVDVLKSDPHVDSAQANFRYGLPEQRSPKREFSQLKQPQAPNVKQEIQITARSQDRSPCPIASRSGGTHEDRSGDKNRQTNAEVQEVDADRSPRCVQPCGSSLTNC